MANHAIQRESIGPREGRIVEVKLVRSIRCMGRQPVVLGAKLRKGMQQQLKLSGLVHVYAD